MAAANRSGFTLVEQVVALVILVVIGAAVVPFIIGALDRERVEEAAASLQGIIDGTTSFNRDVRGTDLLPFPASLSHLTTPITAGALDLCSDAYTSGHAAAWRGPYIDRVVGGGGIDVAIGTAQDAFTVVADGNATLLSIQVTGVTIEDAEDLNVLVDGEEGMNASTAGTVRWGATDAEGRVLLQYLRPVPECP